jgi:hypothetical protein
MVQKLELARELEERASQARSLSEAQALITEADRLRGNLRATSTTPPAHPLIRN